MRANYIIIRVGILFIAVLCCISVAAQSTKTDSIGASEEASIQIAEHPASFPGGEGKLMSWVAQNMHYPEEMEEIQSRVLVSFYVETDGTITDVNVERPCLKENGTSSTVIVEQSAWSALDKEMVRVVKSMPRWEPATHDGKPVREKRLFPMNNCRRQ